MPRPKKVAVAARARRSTCPVAATLDLVGDKWTLLVVRDLASGKSLFKEFLASPEGIATNILAERLGRLTREGLVERYTPDSGSGRDAYRLTAKGRTLRELLGPLKNWGLKHIPGTEVQVQITD